MNKRTANIAISTIATAPTICFVLRAEEDSKPFMATTGISYSPTLSFIICDLDVQFAAINFAKIAR